MFYSLFEAFCDNILLPSLPCVLILFGIYLLFKLKFFNIIHLPSVIKSLFSKSTAGGVSPFAALTVALAGTLGVGNIVGVAVAIALGGPGAVFWMWLSAALSMLIKYSEIVLSVKYRKEKFENGKKVFFGGPMYYIEKASGSRIMPIIFSFICILASVAVGSVIQINAVSGAFMITYGTPPVIVGISIAFLCSIIVLGGIKKISEFTVRLIPAISIFFITMSLFIIMMNITSMPYVFSSIFKNAFKINSIFAGGAYSLFAAVKHGVAKGVLSHEAGCGTAPISHAAASTDSPARQGFWGIFEVFVDTILLCTISAIVIILAFDKISISDTYNGIDIAISCYNYFLHGSASYFITFSILFFAFATIICWSFYGISCVSYIFKRKSAQKIYLLIYCASIVIGSVTAPKITWLLSDFFFCIMTFINCAYLYKMSNEVSEITKNYFDTP